MASNKKSTKKHLFEGKIREYEKQLVDFFAKMGKEKGQAQIFSVIGSYLLIHGSLTQAQLKELTGFSLGSISTTLNASVSIGYIEKKLIKGTHKFKYSFGGDLSQVASKTAVLKSEINDATSEFFQAKMKELNDEGFQNKKGYKILVEQINQMMNFLKIHRKFVNKIPEIIRDITKPKEAE